MCGIVAVLRRRLEDAGCDPDEVLGRLERSLSQLGGVGTDPVSWIECLGACTQELRLADASLRTPSGLRLLVTEPQFCARLDEPLRQLGRSVSELEGRLDGEAGSLSPAHLEELNAAIVDAKDAVWAVRVDRLQGAADARGLTPGVPSPAGIEALGAIQIALSSLDRLEVRGRDSAGLHLMITGHALDLESEGVRRRIEERSGNGLFGHMSAQVSGETLNIVYKTAAEIGELGDNGAALRGAIRGDGLLHEALAAEGVEVAVLGHTRWASVGMISEANTHPLDDSEQPVDGATIGAGERPYVVAALNGDVDNYADLKAAENLSIREEISTDAKVIPVMMARRAHEGAAPESAFRDTVSAFVGSVAIAAATAAEPDRLFLALRGSGQALYVGFAPGTYVVASEPYGLVEQTSRYLRLDGETPGESRQPERQQRPGGGSRPPPCRRSGGGSAHGLRRHRAARHRS